MSIILITINLRIPLGIIIIVFPFYAQSIAEAGLLYYAALRISIIAITNYNLLVKLISMFLFTRSQLLSLAVVVALAASAFVEAAPMPRPETQQSTSTDAKDTPTGKSATESIDNGKVIPAGQNILTGKNSASEEEHKNGMQRFGEKIKKGFADMPKKLVPTATGSLAGTGAGLAATAALAPLAIALGPAAPIAIPLAVGATGAVSGLLAREGTTMVMDTIDEKKKEEQDKKEEGSKKEEGKKEEDKKEEQDKK
ncbi:hypothetical protein BDF22DRAFT_679006 [Syncephalis plumigaleata]|nr:hypothetical protein BDF22DRAFT_679006 [Syncephalis plumigaleata]